jgi:hypothetical protein
VPAVSIVMCSPRSRSRCDKFDDAGRDHRFAAGQDHMARGGECRRAIDNFVDRQFLAFRLPRRVRRIAPGAAQIAAAGATKTDGTPTSPPSPCTE